MTGAVRRGRPEDDLVRKQIIPFYVALGFDVYATSAQVHAKGVTPGIPDLYVVSEKHGFAFWHEAKRPIADRGWKRQSAAQRQFQQRVGAITPYVLGDIESAYDFAQWIGLGIRIPNGFHRDVAPTALAASHIIAQATTRWNDSGPALHHQNTWGA